MYGTTHRLLLPPGENYVSGSIQTLAVGNTEAVARRLQALTGADLFQLEPMQPYSDDYNECIQQAQDDQRRDARPALKACPETLDPYDTIYLGYPNYWGTMPMCVFTFFGTVRFHRQDHPPLLHPRGQRPGPQRGGYPPPVPRGQGGERPCHPRHRRVPGGAGPGGLDQRRKLTWI